MRCIECEEIELARVRDAAPGADAPDPVRGARRLPRRPHARGPHAPPAAAVGRRRLRLGLRRQGTRLRAGLGVGRGRQRRAEEKCLVVLYLAGGNDGLNVLIPERSPPTRQSYASRGRRSTACSGPAVRHPTRVGSHAAARARRRGARVRQRPVVQPAAATTGHALNFTGGRRLDTLFGNGTGGAGSDLAVMPAVDAKQYNLSHFDNSDIWFQASNDLNVKTGWLGRWIDRNGTARTRCRRSRSTPRSRSRSARRPTRCARSRRCR